MAKPGKVEALVSPKLLKWARERASLSVAEAAKRSRVRVERLGEWEDGERRPSVAQLRKLAGVYKRPLSVFFLHEPPPEPDARSFFRKLPEALTRPLSPEVTQRIREAEARRRTALDLQLDFGGRPAPFQVKVDREARIDVSADRLRRALGVTLEVQERWHDQYEALNAWRAAVERLGILTLQVPGVSLGDMRGSSIFDSQLPAILLNSKDSPRARIFTLLHELSHLALGEGELTSEEIERSPDNEEVFCNALAGQTLVPNDALARSSIREGARLASLPQAELSNLSRFFWVSEAVILRRLLDTGRITTKLYRAENDRLAAMPRPKAPESFARKREDVVLTALGRRFVETVLDALDADRISTSDASNYLNLKVKYLPALEERLGRAS